MTPSPGAIRAAEIMATMLKRCHVNRKDTLHIAAIIDRETKAGKLLEACKRSLTWMASHKSEWIGESITADEFESYAKPMQAAIADVEGRAT